MNRNLNLKIDINKLKNLSKFTKTKNSKAIIQIINSFGPFIALWILMYISLSYSYWITLGLGILNAFFLVRIFIIQHDCGHRTWSSNKAFRNITGYVCSLCSAIPYNYWAKSHHLHHSHNGQLEMRDIGDITTLTVNEYQGLSSWGKFKYRLYRSFIVMFVLGPIYYIVIHNRLPLINMDVFKGEKRKLFLHNLLLIGIFTGLAIWLGIGKFLLTHFTVLFFFAVVAVWFFYVQHQHEEAYKQWIKNWNYLTAALKGSTYYKVPAVFNWLTGNIGIHHIHHLNPAIPNYNLKKALKENQWVNEYTTTLGFFESLKLMKNKLWDESTQRMITFKEYKQVYSLVRVNS
ncbi:MAG TPA: fatty acid desaturase [Saprospiraceae bacterium]|nr:fatty acid desaturase [Saprospiraceae bacterium]MCB9328509.1 fatty acid desaturase [Lewinellaceae bacterium]HRX28544.1 fatty acid desaturase [Saprospiraceae bacterium]